MPKDCETCFAGREPFSELCPRDAVGAPAGVRHRNLAKAETLFLEGDTPQSVYILRRGLVKLYRGAKSGRHATVRLVRPGELFGYISLLCGSPYSLSAEGLLDSDLCVFSAAAFTRTLDEGSEFTRGLLERTVRELRGARRDLTTYSGLDAAGKVAGRLLELGQGMDTAGISDAAGLHIPRAVLGEMSGLAQETVSRVLGRLEARRLIERKGRTIFIRDREGLRKLARN